MQIHVLFHRPMWSACPGEVRRNLVVGGGSLCSWIESWSVRRWRKKLQKLAKTMDHLEKAKRHAEASLIEEGKMYIVRFKPMFCCCWAFAAVAATEGLVKIATGNLISMSEQQVLDCTSGRNTCKGGDIGAALRFISSSGGLQQEAAYPYVSGSNNQEGMCRSDVSQNSAAAVGTPRALSLQGDEGALQQLVASQPVAVAFEADPDFQHYRGGVFTGSSLCGQKLNHGMTVVGYGTDGGGQEYWMVKNQYGTRWGEDGYIRLTRGNGSNCGIARYAYYPTMDSS